MYVLGELTPLFELFTDPGYECRGVRTVTPKIMPKPAMNIAVMIYPLK